MMEINTTPLIDVMLVLIIMFIITIPIQTHAVKLDLPQNDPNPQTPPPIDPVKNKIVVTQAMPDLWNGTPVNQQQLRQYLDVTQQMNPVPSCTCSPSRSALRAGRPGAGDHQAGQGREDGLRRQRSRFGCASRPFRW
jgi:biopolymer transport protein ExbD